jgi:hypothetical protein
VPSRPLSGEEAVIARGTAAGVDDDAWDLVREAILANNQAGIGGLVRRGRAFLLDAGDRVLVLDQSLTATKVRALSGNSSGQAGWIPFEHVRTN